MKKVLFVATLDSHIKLFHLPYLKYFKEQGYEVHVATNTKEDILYCDKKIEIPIERSPYSLSNIKAVRILRGILKSEKYDIIHCHTPMGSVVTRIAAIRARRNGTRVIYTAHGFHFYKGAPLKNWLLFYTLEYILARYTDALITINKEDYKLALNKFKTKVYYVPGVGLDENKFSTKLPLEEKKFLRDSLNLKESDFVMIYPAELNDNKNQLMLIKSMIELNKNIHLLLPGKDSYNGYYQKLVSELNLENNIHFLGFRKDINMLLQISNISVSTSKREGLPVNIMEAMYMGLPIVATNCRGNRELVLNDINGYLIKKDNVSDLSNKINMLYSNKDLLDRLGRESKNMIKPYLLDNVMKEMKKIY